MSDQPSDWRRRSPRDRAASAPETDEDQEMTDPAPEAEDQLSRTLFSFIEPTVDTIASFGAPMVLAGIVALVAGISLVAFVPSMRLYGVINVGIGVFLIGLIGLISLSSVFSAFISRTGRYGVNSTIMVRRLHRHHCGGEHHFL